MRIFLNKQGFVSCHIWVYKILHDLLHILVFYEHITSFQYSSCILNSYELFIEKDIIEFFLFIWINIFLYFEYWFRKDITLLILPNQHSNGILDFDSVSDSDTGQYVCHGENRVGFTEEIVTLELLGI